MPPILHIRRATPADAPRCADIFLAGRKAAFPWAADRFQHADYAKSVQDETVWVIERGGLVCGFASLYEPEAFLHNLFVDPACHRQGLGRALLDHLCRRASGPITLKCVAANQPALAFYRAHGWTEIGTGTSDMGEYLVLRSPASARP